VPDVRDPLGVRDVVRFVQVMQGYVDPVAPLTKSKVEDMADILSQFEEALEALTVVVDVKTKQGKIIPTRELAVRCLAIGQAFARGEGDEADSQGFSNLGDMATELADTLYQYATEA
jgi:hypothetical protein